MQGTKVYLQCVCVLYRGIRIGRCFPVKSLKLNLNEISPKIREDLGFFIVLFCGLLRGYFCNMEIYEAIRQMKEKSERGEVFSFAFMSYSYERNKSQGIIKIEHARLRKQSTLETNRFADYMLNFIDTDTLEYGMCWQMLLLEFDGNELELT